MSGAVSLFYYYVLILMLLAFRPALLFQKINSLPWYKKMLTGWVDALQYKQGDQVLEIGCATGELSRYMAQQGLAVNAVDYSAAMLKIAARSNTNGISYQKADVEKLPFPDNTFDLVLAASVINIVPDPLAALAEMRRVCKPGGRISVLVPKEGMENSNITRLIVDLGLKGFSRSALMTWHSSAPKMRAETLLEHCHQAGIQKTKTSTNLNGMILTVSCVKE
jgi:ubiquinone/menaquinone biosynthesis C-methylase UbiE